MTLRAGQRDYTAGGTLRACGAENNFSGGIKVFVK